MQKVVKEALEIEHEDIPGMSYDPRTGPTTVFRKKKGKKTKAKRYGLISVFQSTLLHPALFLRMQTISYQDPLVMPQCDKQS